MFLLVGLGNPGPDYAHNRHNIGFMAVDAIHRHHRFGPWKSRFSAAVAEGVLGDVRTILVKPMTYMNESGRAVGDAARFHKVELGDILVIHDEIDLPPAKVRMKTGGGSGGHNGIRSLVAHLGDGFRRMRLGVGHPGSKAEVHGHVLRDFAKADAVWLAPLLDAIADNAPLLAEGKDATFANRVHLALTPAEPDALAGGKKDATKPAKAGSSTEARSPEKPEAGLLSSRPPDKPDGPDGPLARGLKVLFGRKA